jgi:inner membrane protein
METYFAHTQEQAAKKTGKMLHNIVGARARPVMKFSGVLLLILLLMIPLGFIRDQVTSRAERQREVIADVASSAASSQTVIGPILAIHYRTKQGYLTSEHIKYVPAKKLAIRGDTHVEPRYRGIYEARLFRLDAKVEGSFEPSADMIDIPHGSEFVDASAAILFSLSDLRGLDSNPDVQADGKVLRFKTPDDKRYENAIGGNRLEIDLGAWTPNSTRTIAFSFPLKLTGTEELSISPTAENNIVELNSNWKHPSFRGRFLPRKRDVTESGFTAQWEISQLARNLENALKVTPEQSDSYRDWDDYQKDRQEVLKIRFIDPVNIYLQAERAVKYGSLFIVLTFAALFIGEALRRRPMHIMQYALVGLSLAIFFLLLIALSEHLPFSLAYLAGAVACIGLITIYLAGVFGSWRMASGFGGGLAALYGMLFAILRLEDMALLMGSLILFAALAAAMLSTRRFDWYQLKQGETAVQAAGE